MTDDEWLEVARRFFHFMKNRASFQNEDELKISYGEFKQRIRDSLPDFPSFLDKLKSLKVIRTKGDKIYFNVPTAPPTPDGKRKSAQEILQELKSNSSSDLVSDKNGISITSDPPFNKATLQMEGEFKISRKVKIENSGKTPVALTYHFFLSKVNNFTLVDLEPKVTPQNPRHLQPGASCEIQVDFQCRHGGDYQAEVAFEFRAGLQTGSAPFYIVRFIKARCVTPLGRKLGPVAPYTHHQRVFRPVDSRKIIRDQPRYKVMDEKKMRSLVYGSDKTPYRMLLESSLTWDNYTKKLQLLLHLEEFQMLQDNQSFKVPTMKRAKRFLVLELPGLSESRPSVQKGDELYVYPVREKNYKYLCSVVSVWQRTVTLDSPPLLLHRFRENMKFHVQFIGNRWLLCLQHRAVEQASHRGMQKLLFPVMRPREVQLPDLGLFDERIRENPEQYQAVQHIVSGSSPPAPYLVFGPPGSGKTATLVEAIRQIETTQEICHILACAHTNRGADQLCEKILHPDNEGKVYRFYARRTKPSDVPERLKRCSNMSSSSFSCSIEDLRSYRVIVSTLFTASRLNTQELGRAHFTHVFVDEAEDALETECLIPLAGLVRARHGQVVLAGDPKQLGPIVKCATAQKYGMGVSLFERLLIALSKNGSVDGPFDRRFVTKLLLSYRSHPDILEVPRVLFYKDGMRPYADDSWNDFCNWEGLRQKGFPVIFHVVRGHEDREGDSPSFFNVDEVEVLQEYVQKLLGARDKDGSKVKPKDIGIIAPYRKQVEKVREALEFMDGSDMKDLKVGTVEEFQGDEKRIILVSTVRTSIEHLANETMYQQGWVTNDKKFNVALTRANALLIVVGNPSILARNDNWKTFISFCKEKGGYSCHKDYENGEEEDGGK